MTAAVILMALSLALLEVAVTGLPGGETGEDARRATALRRLSGVLRLLLLAGLFAAAAAGLAAGAHAPALLALGLLGLLHWLEQLGRLRLLGARWAGPGRVLARLLGPLVRWVPLRTGSSEGDDSARADALEDMADLLARAPEERQDMVRALLTLEQTAVEDIMIPRNEVFGIDQRWDWDEIVDRLARTPHTRLPYFTGDLEKVVGVIHMTRVANDLATGRLDRERLGEIASQREALFVPRGTSLQAQLMAFRQLKRRVAFVVDEYGDVLGMVTLEDILGEVVGHFTHQAGALDNPIDHQADGSCVLAGSAPVRLLNRQLGWDLPTDGPRTLSGLVIEYLETIPEPGTSLKLAGRAIEILQTGDNTIRAVRLWPDRPS